MESPTESRKKYRAVRWIALGGLLIAIILLALPKIDFTGDEDNGSGKNGAAAKGRGGPAQVVAYVVQVGQTNTPITLAGTLLPNEETDITSEVSGKITGIYFTEGQFVSQGTPLAQLNDSELQASLKKAEVRLNLAELNEKRKEGLLERNGVSTAEYEIALNELEVARADIALLQAQIEKTVIRAPFSGRVGLRHVSKGAYVTPSTVLTTLYDLDPLKLEFSIPESYALRVTPGTIFRYTVKGISGERSARVYAVEAGVDPSTRTRRVRATSPNSNRDLLPGQFAAVQMPVGTTSDLPIIPTMGVIPTIDGQQVMIVKDGKAAPRSIKTGARSESFIEVSEGLQAGDTVIIEGIQTARPGSPVIPVIRQ
ncbi:MAG: efflux RND transporter periplasmic adaptor subunit [Candidatus Kapaibacterium sp.]